MFSSSKEVILDICCQNFGEVSLSLTFLLDARSRMLWYRPSSDASPLMRFSHSAASSSNDEVGSSMGRSDRPKSSKTKFFDRYSSCGSAESPISFRIKLTRHKVVVVTGAEDPGSIYRRFKERKADIWRKRTVNERQHPAIFHLRI